jgi:hypothetical protein
MKYTLQFVPQDMGLYDMLNQFQTGKSMSAISLRLHYCAGICQALQLSNVGHLAVVRDTESGNVLGIITLEDVIEELINEEIVDETDVYVDVTNRVHVVRPKPEAGGKSAAIRSSSSVFAMASGRATGLSTSALTASYHDSVCACMVVQAVVLWSMREFTWPKCVACAHVPCTDSKKEMHGGADCGVVSMWDVCLAELRCIDISTVR